MDVLKNVKLEYEGINGVASAKVYNTISYDGDDQKIKSFLNDNPTYSLSKNGNLANGDTATISVKYNSSKANALKLNVKDMTKEMKVSGINSQFESASQISTDLKDELKSDSSYAVRNVISQDDADTYDINFVDAWLVKCDRSDMKDCYIGCYKVHETYTDSDGTTDHYF